MEHRSGQDNGDGASQWFAGTSGAGRAVSSCTTGTTGTTRPAPQAFTPTDPHPCPMIYLTAVRQHAETADGAVG